MIYRKMWKNAWMIGLALSVFLTGCNGTKGSSAEEASNTPTESYSTISVSLDEDDVASEAFTVDENKELLKQMQTWIDEPENYFFLLDTFSTSEDICWEDALYEAAMRGYLGTPLEKMPPVNRNEYLELAEKEELKKGVFVITDEEIRAYTEAKVGTAYELTKEAAAKKENVWYRGGKDTLWYCDVSSLHTVDYKNDGIPQYKFICTDVTESDGNIILKTKSYAYTNYHQAVSEIHLIKGEAGYQVLSNEIHWEEGAVKVIPSKLSMFDGEVSFAVYDDEKVIDKKTKKSTGTHSFSIALIHENEVYDWIDLYEDEGNLGFIKTVDEVLAADYDLDGKTDLIVITDRVGGHDVKLYYWDEGYNSNGYYLCDFGLSRHVSYTLENPDANEVLAYLTDGHDSEGFSDYKEAFKYTARNYSGSSSSDGTLNNGRFSLIYFDEDDIPELVAGNNGYSVSVYQFKDGKVYPIISDWGYGAGGNAGYEYYERAALIENFDQDGAGSAYYDTYLKLNEETHKMETVLYYYGVNATDDDCGEPGYFKYVDGEKVEITESEYNILLSSYLMECSSNTTKFLCGDMTYSELVAAIDNDNYGYTDYRDAYLADIKRYTDKNGDKARFALVYVTDEETPELLAEIPGERFSLYRMENGSSIAILEDQSYKDYGEGILSYYPGDNLFSYTTRDENAGTEDTCYYRIYVEGRYLYGELWKYGKKGSDGVYSYTYKRDSAFTGFEPEIVDCSQEDFEKYFSWYTDGTKELCILQGDSTSEEISIKLQH